MNETTHPARRLRHGERPTEPLVFEDAAANKAAEEGGLPSLPLHYKEGVENGGYYLATDVIRLLATPRSKTGERIVPAARTGSHHTGEKIISAGASKESVLSALTDERKRAMFEEWATKQGGYDLSPYNWRVKSVGGVPYTGYVRPYKQDRTVHAFEGFVAALGEVAAQAGQVAVPEGWKLVPQKATTSMYTAGSVAMNCGCDPAGIYADMTAAAPSPAKESK